MNYQDYADLVMSRLQASHGGEGHFGDHMSLDTWEWPQGVAVYAMFKVWQATGDAKILSDLTAWYARHLAQGLPQRNINTTCPMLTMTLLYEATHEESYRPLIADWAQWVMTGLPRSRSLTIADRGGFDIFRSLP